MPRTAKKQPEKLYPLIGEAVGQLGLRLLLAYEFFESGLTKWNGENWFAEIQDQFPFPFSLFSPDANWYAAMGTELLFPVLLLLGLFTRFSAFALMVLTAVAWAGRGRAVAGLSVETLPQRQINRLFNADEAGRFQASFFNLFYWSTPL